MWYHGTTREAAESIRRDGFLLTAPRAHDVGDFGWGIYLTRSLARANTYGEVVLDVEVELRTVWARIANPYFICKLTPLRPCTDVEWLFHSIAFDRASGNMLTCGQGASPEVRRETAVRLRDSFLRAGFDGIITDLEDKEAVIFNTAVLGRVWSAPEPLDELPEWAR
jgi:hypothetical protein